VGFQTPGGKKVLIVQNETEKTDKAFMIRFAGQDARASLTGQAVATYVW
jgi:O-glycosyl hydrolase